MAANSKMQSAPAASSSLCVGSIESKPEAVSGFLRATLRGWQWAMENPDEASLLSLEYDESLNEEHEKELFEATLPLIHTGEYKIGWMRPEVWHTTHGILVEQGLVPEEMEVDSMYTTEFLEEIYGETQ